MGCSSLLGGSPFASSIAVMPRDQMSACGMIINLVQFGRQSANGNNAECKWRNGDCQPTESTPRVSHGSASFSFLATDTFTCLGIVGGLFDDLGRHPEWRADEGVSFAGGVRQLPGHAKVGQLDVAHLAQQHVRR